jgi:hypothetical protein
MLMLREWGSTGTRGLLAAVAVCAVLVVPSARADLVDLGYELLPRHDESPASEESALEAFLGTDLTFLGRLNAGTGWEAGSIPQVSASIVGPVGMISWDLTGTGFYMALVTVKDGENGANKDVLHLYGVTQDQLIQSTADQYVDFADQNDPAKLKDISHISFWATPVPEPTTLIAGALLLLPFGASTIRMLRNKRNS